MSQGPGEGEQTVAVSLPAVVHSSHHSLPLHLTFPSLSSRCPSLPSSPSYSSSAQKQDKESGAERHTRQFPVSATTLPSHTSACTIHHVGVVCGCVCVYM